MGEHPPEDGWLKRVTKIRFGRVLTLCLLAVLLLLVFEPRRGLGAKAVASVAKSVRAEWLRTFGWPQIRDGASIVHGTGATVDIVMFTDYECPFCKSQDAVLDSLRSIRPSLGLAVRHVVRPGSVRGRDLAVLALCAESTDAWPEINSSLYDLAPLPEPAFRTRRLLALEELLPRREAADIVACTEAPPTPVMRRLQRDSILMAHLRLEGTPTLLGRGMQIVGLRSLTELREGVSLPEPGEEESR